MSNRIREFRNKKGLSQSQFVQSFNELLKDKKTKPITIPTFSRWENSVSNPTEKMWENLSSVMNTPVLVLKGAFSKNEILKVLKNSYISRPKLSSLSYSMKQTEIMLDVGLIAVAKGLVFYDKKSIDLLYDQQVNDFEFWNKNFSFIFDSVAVKWLITKPLDATKSDIVDALKDALSTELLRLERDDRDQKNGEEWIEPPKKLLEKRQNYIDEHTFIDEDGATYLDFSRTISG